MLCWRGSNVFVGPVFSGPCLFCNMFWAAGVWSWESGRCFCKVWNRHDPWIWATVKLGSQLNSLGLLELFFCNAVWCCASEAHGFWGVVAISFRRIWVLHSRSQDAGGWKVYARNVLQCGTYRTLGCEQQQTGTEPLWIGIVSFPMNNLVMIFHSYICKFPRG